MPTPLRKTSVPTSNTQINDSGLCNVDSSCLDDNKVCVEGVCISEGNPRVTLQWPKGSFYSLHVVTPDGKHISAFSPFDINSGGFYERPSQQLSQDDNIESVYFPIEGGPQGLYSFSVSTSGGGDFNGYWVARAYVNGTNVAIHTGTGSSNLFSFQFGGSSLPAEDDLKKPQPSGCDSTLDCLLLSTRCVQQICIEQGTPQFVLSWNGYSDLALNVATPLHTTISSKNPLDLESGGKFRSYDIVNDLNSHLQSVYFEPEQGPTGLYPFYIHSYDDKGDTWTLTIFVDGEEITSYSGQGTSEILIFDYGEIPPIEEPLVIESPHQEQCNLTCTFDEICVRNICVKKGSPQFLLTWQGDYEIALTVVTPAESIISWQHPLDSETGGEFHDHIDEEEFRRFENIFFAPDNGPLGVYPYYIHSFATNSDDDTWTFTIYIDGQEVLTKNGQGSSEVLFFDYSGNLPTNYPFPTLNPTINPTTNLFQQ